MEDERLKYTASEHLKMLAGSILLKVLVYSKMTVFLSLRNCDFDPLADYYDSVADYFDPVADDDIYRQHAVSSKSEFLEQNPK